jgi:hypothetical protein
MKYPSGNSYEGEWKDDKKSGYGIMIWRDMDEVYTGMWSEDLPHGYGEHIWGDSNAKTIKKQNCNIYRGFFHQGKRDGQGSFFYMNGSQYTGFWKNDLKHGPGIFIYPDGKIVAGNYEENRLSFSLDKEFIKMRVTEDINPQYNLSNILSLFDFYPSLEYNVTTSSLTDRFTNQKKLISDIERLLLKYNQFLKTVYRHYHELTNKSRQREIPYVPTVDEFESMLSQITSTTNLPPLERQRYRRFNKSTTLARNIHKRFFSATIEFFIRFLREMGLLDGVIFNVQDLLVNYDRMKEDQLSFATKEYTALMETYLNEKNGTLQRSASPTSLQSPNSSAVLPPPPTSANGVPPKSSGVDESKEQQHQQNSVAAESGDEGSFTAGEGVEGGESISTLLLDAELNLDRLYDSYRDIRGADGSNGAKAFSRSLIQQPLLEHEFIELFIRVVAEREVREAGQYTNGVSYNLYQAVERILAQRIFPYSADIDSNRSVFFKHYHDTGFQDLLHSRPNRSVDIYGIRLEMIWKDIRSKYTNNNAKKASTNQPNPQLLPTGKLSLSSVSVSISFGLVC